MKTIKILILEDDLQTLSALLHRLAYVFNKKAEKIDFNITIVSDSDKVKRFINKLDKDDFDIILLDRDCQMCGSFHILDIEKFGAEKVIAISSIPSFNKELFKKYGIDRIARKEYNELDRFASEVILIIKKMLNV